MCRPLYQDLLKKSMRIVPFYTYHERLSHISSHIHFCFTTFDNETSEKMILFNLNHIEIYKFSCFSIDRFRFCYREPYTDEYEERMAQRHMIYVSSPLKSSYSIVSQPFTWYTHSVRFKDLEKKSMARPRTRWSK